MPIFVDHFTYDGTGSHKIMLKRMSIFIKSLIGLTLQRKSACPSGRISVPVEMTSDPRHLLKAEVGATDAEDPGRSRAHR